VRGYFLFGSMCGVLNSHLLLHGYSVPVSVGSITHRIRSILDTDGVLVSSLGTGFKSHGQNDVISGVPRLEWRPAFLQFLKGHESHDYCEKTKFLPVTLGTNITISRSLLLS